MYFIVHSAGTRAPGSGNIPTDPTNLEDEDDKGGLSAGAIVGIVLGSIAVIIVLAFIFVKCSRESTPKTVATLAPAPAVEYNALPPTTYPPECAYRPEPGFPVHSASVNIPPPPVMIRQCHLFLPLLHRPKNVLRGVCVSFY